MAVELSQNQLESISACVAQSMGLHFPGERRQELRRGIMAAATELGFANRTGEFADWLAASPVLTEQQLQALATHLTVGETYFFRDRTYFDFLAQRIVPEILRTRRGQRPLRIWCAACCTGEEAYTLAIALRQAIPDVEPSQWTLLATDINPRYLRKAQAGIFGQWSFRNVSPGFRETYFRPRSAGQFEIVPEIRRLVRFMPFNLAAATPATLSALEPMDVIFCRNVLMYFTPQQAAKAIGHFHGAQPEGGWLVVGPSELLYVSPSPYRSVIADNVVVFRKLAAAKNERPAQVPNLPLAPERPSPRPANSAVKATANIKIVEVPDPRDHARSLYNQQRYGEAIEVLEPLLSDAPGAGAAELLGLLARALANQGRLPEALACCERWIAADRFNPAAHYLRALILQEQAAVDAAAQALRTVLYLEPAFVLAHFALGNMARERGHTDMARRYFANAADLLRGRDPHAIVSESEGMTVGELLHLIPDPVAAGANS